MKKKKFKNFQYNNHKLGCAHVFLLPTVINILRKISVGKKNFKIFDLGCGNGSVANRLYTKESFSVTGVDPSAEGIKLANKFYPQLKLNLGSGYDNLQKKYGKYSAVICLEVIEHVYSPRILTKTILNLLQPGGTAIISTPYHGYLKNFLLSLSGKMDAHFTALWDGGHIKFFSLKTLKELLEETGFKNIDFKRVGRIPIIAKSMIAIAHKPLV
jgi:2-polyprenyl-3-methyl-5-hydroxy-6-metoxy-1,4-benzoquinol methylase